MCRKQRHAAAAVLIGLLMLALCFALPCTTFAEDGGTQLAVRHAYFAYGFTECTDEEQLIIPEPTGWQNGPYGSYPESYATTMMLCDSDHVVYVFEDGESCDNVTFASSNTSVLEIDDDGRVTLKKSGTARITAAVAADEVYAERVMYLDVRVDRHEGWLNTQWVHYVDRPYDWGLELDISDGPQQMVLALRPGAAVTYTSENPNVARVDQNGVVTPLTAGTTQIWFEIDSGGGRYKACRFAQTINVSGEDISVSQKITGDLGPFTIDWHDGLALDLHAKTKLSYYISEDSSGEPEVDENGFVSFRGIGTAFIRVVAEPTSEYKSAEVYIDIYARDFAAEAAEEEAAAQAAAEAAAKKAAEEAAAKKAAEEAAAKKAAEKAAAKKASEEAAAKKAAEEAAAEKAAAKKAAKKAAAKKAAAKRAATRKKAAAAAQKAADKEAFQRAARKAAEVTAARQAAEEKAAEKAALNKELHRAKALKKPALKAKALKGGKIKLTWSKVRNTDGYILYVKYPGSKKYVKAVKKDATVKSVTHRGLTAGMVYSYKVRAFKKVNGKCYYGSFSKVRKVRVR